MGRGAEGGSLPNALGRSRCCEPNMLQPPSSATREPAAHRSQQAATHHAPKQTRVSVSLSSYLSVPFCEHRLLKLSESLSYSSSPAQSTSLFSLPTGHILERKGCALGRIDLPRSANSYHIRSHTPPYQRKTACSVNATHVHFVIIWKL